MDFLTHAGTLEVIEDIPNSLYEIEEPINNGPSANTLEDINYEANHVLLFKKVPFEATELDIATLCQRFGLVTDIYIMRNKGYAFVQFQQIKSSMFCYDLFKKESPIVKGQNIYVFHTGKREIYKQDVSNKPPCRNLLLMFSTGNENINTHFIGRLIGPFGRIEKIKLLQSHPCSLMVEMADIGSAITIKEKLNNTIISNSFKVLVNYYYQKQSVNQPEQDQLHFSSLQNIPMKPTHSFAELYPPGMNIGFARSEGHFPRSEGNLMDFREPESLIIKSVHSDMTSLSSYEPMNKSYSKPEETGSNTVLVKNLPRGMHCKELFRIFGLYGNVMKVKIFYSNPENALVELQDASQAALAKTHLNNCAMRGTNIFVTISKNPIIFNVPSIPEGNQFLGDYTDSKEHRYKIVGSKNCRNIAPPSQVLHMSNLCDDLDERFYMDLFKECGRIKRFMLLKGDIKNVLVEMENTQQAVEIIMRFHNFNINGKFLKVSFSKYQNIRD